MEKIKELYKKYKEVINYLIFGGLTTVVNFVCYLLLTKVLGAEEVLSNVIALVVSILFAYVTNKIFVFESKTVAPKEIAKEMVSFFACRGVTSLIDIGLFALLVKIMGINDILVKLFNQVLVIVLNYVFSKLIIFKKKDRKGEVK